MTTQHSKRLATLALAGLLVAGAEACSSDLELFIAQQSDFRDYASWDKVALGVAVDTTDGGVAPGHPVGLEYGFRSRSARNGVYPIGTMLVKEVDLGSSPKDWELFAMAKRGGGYNTGGALDWEFFTIRLSDPDLIPLIVTRGSNPADNDSQGHGYGLSQNGVTCNRCHGIPGTEQYDHTLSLGLRP